jgi:hypothetical protein
MLTIQSKVSIDSEAAPGVTYVIRRLSKLQRAKRDIPVLAERVKFTELYKEYQKLDEPKDAAVHETNAPRLAALDYEMGLLMDAHLKPAAIRAGLVSIEGFAVEGYAQAADAVIQCGDDSLIDEIWGHCEALAGLSGEQQKNSSSPTTGAGQGTTGETSLTA